MKHPELRIIVEGMLEGDRDPEDLNRLFGYLRGRTLSRAPAVKDIGDAQAHWTERDEGLSYERAVRFVDLWRVAFKVASTLEDYHRGLAAALASIGPAKIKSQSGLPYTKAERAVRSIIGKMEELGPKRLGFKERLTSEEERLLRALHAVRPPSELLTQTQLFEQLTERLVGEGLLHREEVDPFSAASDWVAAYAVSKLHQVTILRPNTKEIVGQLKGRPHDTTGTIAIYLSARLRDGPGLIGCLFLTDLHPEKWASEELHDIDAEPVPVGRYIKMSPAVDWDFPIRLSSEGKLVPKGKLSEPVRQRAAHVRKRLGRTS